MRDHDWQIFNRVYIGQVISVNPRNGTVSVFIGDGLGSKKDNLEIPVHALSVNGARDSDGTLISAFRSSWIRYMPQEYDLVYVAFGPQNQARILGHATHPGTYKQLVDLKNANSTLYPQELVNLERGEWDMRSSGGAYIHGSKRGDLLLSAGPNMQMRLSKDSEELRGKSGLWDVKSKSSFLRLGAVKRRLLQTDFVEVDMSSPETILVATAFDPLKAPIATPVSVALVAEPADTEYWLRMAKSDPTGFNAFLYVDEQRGTIRDDFGAPEFSSIIPTSPLRHRKRVYVPLSTELASSVSYEEQIDDLGNVSVSQGETATVAEFVGGPLTQAEVSCLTANVNASSAASVYGGLSASLSSDVAASVEGGALAELTSSIKSVVDALTVQLGSDALAVHSAVHGEVLLALLTQISTILGLIAAHPLIGPTDPSGNIVPQSAALATALTAFSTPGPTGLLSPKVKLE